MFLRYPMSFLWLPNGALQWGYIARLVPYLPNISSPSRLAPPQKGKNKSMCVAISYCNNITIFLISIHAPTRGATLHRYRVILTYNGFNPRTHAGCDTNVLLVSWADLFQSTHPRGVRQRTTEKILKQRRFNPRTHAGCDFSPRSKLIYTMVFQSTHPRGVRRVRRLLQNEKAKVSIHAPTRGATFLARVQEP